MALWGAFIWQTFNSNKTCGFHPFTNTPLHFGICSLYAHWKDNNANCIQILNVINQNVNALGVLILLQKQFKMYFFYYFNFIWANSSASIDYLNASEN